MATPIIATQRAGDLSKTSNVYPIIPEFEESLEPSDYDAYEDTANW